VKIQGREIFGVTDDKNVLDRSSKDFAREDRKTECRGRAGPKRESFEKLWVSAETSENFASDGAQNICDRSSKDKCEEILSDIV
jgi:hypothetical protein